MHRDGGGASGGLVRALVSLVPVRVLRATLGLAGAALVVLSPREGRAEPAPEVRARAAQLAREASQLAASGRHDKACPMLEESDRLDPASTTKLELARCYEGIGRPASAWALYTAVATADANGADAKRAEQARARARALEKKLPKLAVTVSEEVAALPALEVKLDGVVVQSYGKATPVDLGEHTIRASATGKRVWERKVVMNDLGEIVEVQVKAMADVEPGWEPEPAPDFGAPEPAGSGGSPGAFRRNMMFVTGGVAVAAIAVGGTFGALTLAKRGDVDEAATAGCADPEQLQGCSPSVVEMQDTASTYETISIFSFVAGGMALAGTALLWLTLPADAPSAGARLEITPAVGPAGVGGFVRGVF